MKPINSKRLLASLTAGLFCLASVAAAQTVAANACDLNADGAVDDVDVQMAINMSLGQSACTANILGAGVCNVVVVQRIINAKLTGTCVVGTPHSVQLNWVASTTTNVVGYIYRSETPGGPYTQLTTTPVAAITYTDTAVQAGKTYYYVVTAIDSAGNASIYSNEAPAPVPTP